jgi:hypothetical protein
MLHNAARSRPVQVGVEEGQDERRTNAPELDERFMEDELSPIDDRFCTVMGSGAARSTV